MERESFENEVGCLSYCFRRMPKCTPCWEIADEHATVQAIGKLMNDNFINIKVDKEVRSDVDRVYMTYVQVSATKS